MNRQLEQDLPCVAVVGCGAAACEFFLPALRRHRDFQQRVLLVDQSPEQARAVAQQFGLQRTWTRYQEIPGEVEAVIIATPHRWHAEQALYFLERGKHVLVEKPLGMNSGRSVGDSCCRSETPRDHWRQQLSATVSRLSSYSRVAGHQGVGPDPQNPRRRRHQVRVAKRIGILLARSRHRGECC